MYEKKSGRTFNCVSRKFCALFVVEEKQEVVDVTTKNPLIHDAAKIGDADILDLLIESGADVNTRDKQENTPFHHDVFCGHERCVWLLLDKHTCNPSLRNAECDTPLMLGYIKHYTQPSEQVRRAIATVLQKADVEDVVRISRAMTHH